MYTDPRQWKSIRRRIASGEKSIRSLASELGMSRRTVRRIIWEAEPGRYRRSVRHAPVTADVASVFRQLLIEDEERDRSERRPLAAIFRELRDEHGYVGSYDALRRLRSATSDVRLVIDLHVQGRNDAGALDAQSVGRERHYRVAACDGVGGALPRRTVNIVLRADAREERRRSTHEWMKRLIVQPNIPDELAGKASDAELKTLAEGIHSPRPRVRNRALAVCAKLNGLSTADVATFVGTGVRTCRRYYRTFQTAGAGGLLAPDVRASRKFDRADLKDEVFRLLHQPPSAHGINRTSWVLPDLCRVLTAQGHAVGVKTVSRIVRDSGWRWRKARIVLTSQDPAYREKLAAVQAILFSLQPDEAFFSIDEFGPFAVKMKQGLKLDPPGQHRVVPQWQKSKGCMIMTAALDLSGNQVTHFYSDRKDTTEMIRMMDLLVERYRDRRTIYLSWDAASWHVSKKLRSRIEEHNSTAAERGLPRVETAPLPAGAQFLNVIESIFSGMARAVIHNSDYPSADAVREAIDRYFADRNLHFRQHPQRAGKRIWGEELVPPTFSDSNNCKDPRWR